MCLTYLKTNIFNINISLFEPAVLASGHLFRVDWQYVLYFFTSRWRHWPLFLLFFPEQVGPHVTVLPTEDPLLQSPNSAVQQHQHICACAAFSRGGKMWNLRSMQLHNSECRRSRFQRTRLKSFYLFTWRLRPLTTVSWTSLSQVERVKRYKWWNIPTVVYSGKNISGFWITCWCQRPQLKSLSRKHIKGCNLLGGCVWGGGGGVCECMWGWLGQVCL